MKVISQKSKALSLKLRDVFDPEFVREVLERKKDGVNALHAELLHSATSKTLVRKKVLHAFTQAKGEEVRLSDLASFTPSELKDMAKLGSKTLRWMEEYLHLLGVILPQTRSVHGMSSAAREFLASL